MTLSIPERGNCEVPKPTWNQLATQSDFWELVKDKIVEVRVGAAREIILRGNCYVGKALVEGIELDFTEKIPGAVAALISYASFDAFRLRPFEAHRTEMGPLITLLVEQFLQEAARYVMNGRESRYFRPHCVGSLVSGRLDINRTVKLRARGLRHQLAFDRTALTFRTLKNRLIFAAIREVGAIARVVEIEERRLERARELAMVFDDCRDAETLFANRRLLSGQAEKLALSSGKDRDLLGLAAVLLANESFESTARFPDTVPRAWFLNLEDLFEKAVRGTLARALPTCSVAKPSQERASTKGRDLRRYVLDGLYEADPDIVIRWDAATIAVGDVKYKEWDGKPEQSDVYQLIVHAAAFASTMAFLVYPADHFEAISFGNAVTGAEMWAFLVDIRRLSDDLRHCADILGIHSD